MDNAATQLTMLTRLGFAARGLLYLVIAYLVITTGRTEDPAGALGYLGQGGGKTILYIITAGLLAYGLWRLTDAVFDIERHGRDNKAKFARVGAAASGFVHLFLAWQAVKLIQGVAASSANGATENANTVLELPGGAAMLIAGGLILLATGIYQMVKAAKASYLEHLEPRIAAKPWAKWTGRLGYAARGVVFLITGAFITSAGFGEQASEAGGMADALAWLESPWDVIVALGLLAFGLFSLIEARYRVLHDIPVADLGHRARAKI